VMAKVCNSRLVSLHALKQAYIFEKAPSAPFQDAFFCLCFALHSYFWAAICCIRATLTPFSVVHAVGGEYRGCGDCCSRSCGPPGVPSHRSPDGTAVSYHVSSCLLNRLPDVMHPRIMNSRQLEILRAGLTSSAFKWLAVWPGCNRSVSMICIFSANGSCRLGPMNPHGWQASIVLHTVPGM